MAPCVTVAFDLSGCYQFDEKLKSWYYISNFSLFNWNACVYTNKDPTAEVHPKLLSSHFSIVIWFAQELNINKFQIDKRSKSLYRQVETIVIKNDICSQLVMSFYNYKLCNLHKPQKHEQKSWLIKMECFYLIVVFARIVFIQRFDKCSSEL